jgi:plastocyanin
VRVRHFAALTLAVAICAFVGSTPAISRQAGPPPPQQCDPDTTQVEMQDFDFSPDTLAVPVGTTVCWTNVGQSADTVTSDTGVFDSATVLPGGIFSYTFNEAGIPVLLPAA